MGIISNSTQERVQGSATDSECAKVVEIHVCLIAIVVNLGLGCLDENNTIARRTSRQSNKIVILINLLKLSVGSVRYRVATAHQPLIHNHSTGCTTSCCVIGHLNRASCGRICVTTTTGTRTRKISTVSSDQIDTTSNLGTNLVSTVD